MKKDNQIEEFNNPNQQFLFIKTTIWSITFIEYMLKFVHGTNLNNFSLVKETKTNISLTVGKNYEAIVNYEPLEVFSFIGGKVPFFF